MVGPEKMKITYMRAVAYILGLTLSFIGGSIVLILMKRTDTHFLQILVRLPILWILWFFIGLVLAEHVFRYLYKNDSGS